MPPMVGRSDSVPPFPMTFNTKKRKQEIMEMVGMIRPTSKAALKQQCLFLANLDVDKAEKMYDFLIKGMEDIPAVETASKPFMQNFGEQASGVLAWFRENQDVIGQGMDMIRGLVGRKGSPVVQSTPLPPING